MPATYTYNDALDDAKAVIMQAFSEVVPADQAHLDLMLTIGRRLTELKRPSRRKRTPEPRTP